MKVGNINYPRFSDRKTEELKTVSKEKTRRRETGHYTDINEHED